MIKTLIKCMSLQTLLMPVASVLGGWGCAIITGNFEPIAAMFCLIFGVLAVLTSNITGCYFDCKLHNGVTINAALKARGVSELPSEFVLREAMIMSMLFTSLIAIALLLIAGWWTILVGALVIVGDYYLNSSKRYGRRKLKAVLISFLFFGPITVFTVYLIQKVHITGWPEVYMDYNPAIWMSIALGLMANNVLWVINYLGYIYDRKEDVRTVTTVLGLSRVRTIFLISSILIFIAPLMLFYICPWISVFSLVSVGPIICLGINIYIWTKLAPTASSKTLLHLEKLAIWNMFFFALYMLLIFTIVALPSQDPRSYFGIITHSIVSTT